MNLIPKHRREQKERAQEKQAREGGHVTFFGNYFTDEEWAECQAMWEEEAAEAREYLARHDAAVNHGVRMLQATGLFDATDAQLRSALNKPHAVQFTSEEKAEAFAQAHAFVKEQMREF